MSNSPKGLPMLIDYYVGAYGPTIRINVNTLDGLAIVRDTFKTLATGARSVIRISNGPNFRLSGFSYLELRTGKTGDGKHLRKMESADDAGFVWELDPHGWSDCLALVGGLFQSNSGHQYLTREKVDDALVELAYGEGPLPVA
jgi:hypothetical protein